KVQVHHKEPHTRLVKNLEENNKAWISTAGIITRNMAEEKDNVPLKTDGVADESIPLMVIPSKVWTQPYGTDLYDWVATEVLGT
ncbi:hypothetical protein PIB30_091774, partial [Stylosanthes scabra]|nr:hypothetical protein [Stylosanthes scabra]